MYKMNKTKISNIESVIKKKKQYQYNDERQNKKIKIIRLTLQ